MKLQKKINRYFFTASLIVFLISSVISYFVIRALVIEEVDETLNAEKSTIVQQLKKIENRETIVGNHSYRLEISPINREPEIKESFSDTSFFVAGEEENEKVPFRQLKFSKIINSKNYQITLRRSLIEQDDLIIGISILLVVTFLLIIITLNLINMIGEKKWWHPFNETLNKLLNFNLTQSKKIDLPKSDIDEFNDLNKTLEKMTDKLISDYKNLKEFSENASHEMQTPLAIIRSKLDVIIQDKSISEEQFTSIESIYLAVKRLTKLNKSLNLLTKIENQEFAKTENVNFSRLISNQLNNLSELIESKSLFVKTEIEENIFFDINPFIAETFISNLIMNSVKHNNVGGSILISLNSSSMIIKNNGTPPTIPPNEFFNRFKKESQTSDSPGLGLSIAKKICELNELKIDYSYINHFHQFKIYF